MRVKGRARPNSSWSCQRASNSHCAASNISVRTPHNSLDQTRELARPKPRPLRGYQAPQCLCEDLRNAPEFLAVIILTTATSCCSPKHQVPLQKPLTYRPSSIIVLPTLHQFLITVR